MLSNMKRRLYNALLHLIHRVAALFGYELLLIFSKMPQGKESKSVNLNIGAGKYLIEGFQSLDFYSEHYYPDKNEFLKRRTPYDIRNDKIPFDNNVVDNIYVSHVIEHIEDEHVERLFTEANRVLKPGGVLRIVCPDAKFLYQVSQFENDYWFWRHRTLSNAKQYDVDWTELCQLDFLVRELATPRFRFYKDKIASLELQPEDFENLNYEEFVEYLSNTLTFREHFPGDHINLWDIDRVTALGNACGFSHVLESKQFGSVSREMKSLKFDRTAPNMALYVDLIK